MNESKSRPIQSAGLLASSIAGAPNIPLLLLALAAIFFAVVFAAVGIKIHGVFSTSAYDLGLYDQAFWRYSQLLPNFNTVRGMNILGDHFSPIALLFAPLYRIWPDIAWAFALQALSVASGGVLLYLIARHLLPGRPWLCLAFALAYYLHPAVHNTLLWEYHDLVLASGLYMALIWSYVKDRPRLFIVVLVLLLACREDMAITLAAFGIVALLERRWRYGLWAIAISAVWWLLVTRIAMPYFNGVGYFRASTGALALILANFANPSFYLARIGDPQALDYLWKVIVPAGLLGLVAPRYLLPALPTLAANVLIGAYNTVLIYHYSVSIMPFFFWAAVAGSARLARLGETRHPALRPVPALLAVLTVAAALVLGMRYSVMDLGALPRHYTEWQDKAAKRAHVAALDAKFGAEGVAASDWLLPHFSHRERIYLFPNPWKVYNWGINDENPHHPNVIRYIVLERDAIRLHQALYDYLLESGSFARVSDEHGIVTLERVRPEAADRAEAIANFRDFSPIAPPAFTHLWLSPPYATAASEFRRLDLDPSAARPPAGSTPLPDQAAGAILELDLGEAGKSDFTTRYVRAEVDSSATCAARLRLGSDDGLTVWFNGKQVLENIVLRAARIGDDEIDIELNPGKNAVVFRVNNATGAFRLLAALKVHACTGAGR
jgi:uncharacterized membrane protein